MGKQLVAFYDKAGDLGGMKAKMRLTMITQIPQNKAEAEADSSDNIKKFEDALTEIQKEFN